MFTDQELNAYRNIKAPDELHQKIKGSQKRAKKLLYTITVAAACFIFMAASILINGQSNNIVVNGQKLNDSVEFYDTTSSLGRTVSFEISIPIEITVSRNTKISAQQGVIHLDGIAPSKEIEVSSSTMFWWELDLESEEQVYEMIISDDKGAQKIVLEYKDAKITATKEKIK